VGGGCDAVLTEVDVAECTNYDDKKMQEEFTKCTLLKG
jgi:hypothetical protein